jgi:hypothetical protein
MPRVCTICNRKDRPEIDRALVSGATLREITRRFRVSKDASSRHKNHVSQSIVKAAERREERLGDSLLEEMARIKEKIWKMLDAAEAEGDRMAFVALVRELRQTIGGYFELAERSMPKAVGREEDWVEVLRKAQERLQEASYKTLDSPASSATRFPVKPTVEPQEPTSAAPVMKAPENTAPQAPLPAEDWVDQLVGRNPATGKRGPHGWMG